MFGRTLPDTFAFLRKLPNHTEGVDQQLSRQNIWDSKHAHLTKRYGESSIVLNDGTRDLSPLKKGENALYKIKMAIHP